MTATLGWVRNLVQLNVSHNVVLNAPRILDAHKVLWPTCTWVSAFSGPSTFGAIGRRVTRHMLQCPCGLLDKPVCRLFGRQLVESCDRQTSRMRRMSGPPPLSADGSPAPDAWRSPNSDTLLGIADHQRRLAL